MNKRRLRKYKSRLVVTLITLVLAIVPIPAWGYEFRLSDISSTLSGYYSTAKNTLSNVKNKALNTLSSSKLNPANEAQRRAYYQAEDQALKGKIGRVNQKVYRKYDSLVTNKIDGWITPETNSAVKFSVGVAEGIPKGLLDITMLGYNLSQRILPQNIYATSMTTYYKVKDNPEKYAYLAKHPLQTGGAIAGALYDGGKQYAVTVLHDPRAAGNLVGSLVGIGGAGKVVGVAGKGLPTAAKALEDLASIRIPSFTATPVAVGTASRATASVKFSSVPKFTLNTKNLNLNWKPEKTFTSGSILKSSNDKVDDSMVSLFHAASKKKAESIRKNGIIIDKGRPETDFGQGFYLTSNYFQAKKFGERLGDDYEVLMFKIPRSSLADLRSKKFEKPTNEWFQFVRDNRFGVEKHDFDIVEGPMLLNLNALFGGSKVKAAGHQISFHTQKALDILMRGLQEL